MNPKIYKHTGFKIKILITFELDKTPQLVIKDLNLVHPRSRYFRPNGKLPQIIIFNNKIHNHFVNEAEFLFQIHPIHPINNKPTLKRDLTKSQVHIKQIFRSIAADLNCASCRRLSIQFYCISTAPAD